MAFVISEDCISCGACAAECPQKCITEDETKYVIDAARCTECGACGNICPVGAPNKE